MTDAELNALDRRIAAEEWMGWKLIHGIWHYRDEKTGKWTRVRRGDGSPLYAVRWRPTRDPAHAGEARRKAERSTVDHIDLSAHAVVWVGDRAFDGFVEYSETDGNKDLAEALATCRAIEAALQARKGQADAE